MSRYIYFLLILLLIPLLWLTQPVTSATMIMPTFVDQTSAAGVNTTHDTPFVPIGDVEGLTNMLAGAAAGDFNNDGWTDLFVIGGGNEPDALFMNNQDGTFTNEATAWGVAIYHIGSGAAVADYNNDGWLDIFVTSMGYSETGTRSVKAPYEHRLYRNNGGSSFTNVGVSAGVAQTSPIVPDGFGSTFGDYDLDGDLDLFVTAWQDFDYGNRLFRNNGNETFTDVTDEAITLTEGLYGFAPCFQDMNGDHWPELLIAADFGSSRYLVNNGDGTFTDYTTESGTDEFAYGMGMAVADFNNNGRFDWFITSIYGPNLAYDGNKLYLNQGNHTYTQTATTAGVVNGHWGWGTAAVDVNHDGWIDLVETNGWPTNEYMNKPAKVWLNNSDETFTEVAAATGFEHHLQGRGLLHLDYDNDGDQDFVITANRDSLYLYQTNLPPNGTNWLKLFLNTSNDPTLAPNGIGAHIQIHVGTQTYHRTINACSHYLSQSESSATFGIADAQIIDELVIAWPNGKQTVLNNINANQTITISPPPHPQRFYYFSPIFYQMYNFPN